MGWKNKEQKSEYNKKYREQHLQKLKEYNKNWKKENRDHLNEYARNWRNENLDEQREKDRIRNIRWRHKNPEKHKQNIRERKLKTVMALWEYKEQQGGCKECGEKDPRCLDFHHRNPKEKSFNISHGLSNKLSLEALMKEIAKCDLLCRNCHIKYNHRVFVKK